MLGATYFHYDGQWSGRYGLQIVDFDDNPVKETDAFSPSLSLLKAPGSVRFYHGGISYETPPSCEFCVLSETELTATVRSSILSWLVGRKKFKPLSFDSADTFDYTYYCVFTSAKLVWINGKCHGFRLTAQFDSHFARCEPTSVSVSYPGGGVSPAHTITIMNLSDIADDYTYPIVEFTGRGVIIYNHTAGDNHNFSLFVKDDVAFGMNEKITVDNETKHIYCESGVMTLDKFEHNNWLRLLPGANELEIHTIGNVTITCPHYAMIGF